MYIFKSILFKGHQVHTELTWVDAELVSSCQLLSNMLLLHVWIAIFRIGSILVIT
jgi:hypothetical protein